MRIVKPVDILPGSEFSRASVGTYYDRDGVLQTAAIDELRYTYALVDGDWVWQGLLVEGAATNLLTYSEEFDNAAWGKLNVSITANATTSPNGTVTADKIVSTAATGNHYVSGSVSLSANTQYSISFFLEPSEYSVFRIQAAAGGGWGADYSSSFDLIAGTATASGIIERVGDFYRCTILATTDGTAGSKTFLIGAYDSGTFSYTGDGTSGLYVWGANLTPGSLSSYIKSEATTVTRAADVFDIFASTAVNEYPDWVAGSYDAGDRVVNDRIVWEALATVTSEPSSSVPADWLRVGYSNRWRMFTEGRDSKTTATGSIDTTTKAGVVVNTFAALGLQGNRARLVVEDDADGVVFDETQTLVDIGVVDFWEWFFSPYELIETVVFDGIPPYQDARISFGVLGLEEADPVAVGRVAYGIELPLGVTNYGTSVEILDYSTKTRDEFGNLTLVPRRTITLVDYDVTVSSPQVDFVIRSLQKVAGIPILAIGEDDLYKSTVTYGVYRGAVQGISGPTISDLTIQVEEF